MGGVSYVGAEDEGSVGCVGGTGIGFVVGCLGLFATIDSEAGGDESAGLFLDQHLAPKYDILRFNLGPCDRCKRFVRVEMFGEFFRHCSSDIVGIVQEGGAMYSTLYWERVGEEVSVAVIEGRVGCILSTVEFIADCCDASSVNLALDS